MTLRILYVDDDPTLAKLAQRVLGRHDITVVHAASVATGLEEFKTNTFDAVVLDHYFQNGTGLQFLSGIGEAHRDIPVLYVTGASEAQVAIDALKAGAADYVIKNVADDFFPLLLNSIQQALENFQLRREKEEAERQLLQAKERAELMAKEMNHRIANSLSLVSAMIRMQLNAVATEEARTALLETQSRISAIAGVHRSLYTAHNVSEVELGSYLSSIIQDLARSARDSEKIRMTTDMDNIKATPDQAVALGVIVTELTTNALKYAYSDGSGEIRISLKTQDSIVRLIVEDDGIGINGANPPKGTGLGTRLITAMAQSLKATVSQSATLTSGGASVCVQWEENGSSD
ncbi:response regulator [Agrobacterium rosae]|uniref:histidine kinase n=1 Tax=Agrobacterium rosae TaxID=1972867 RepID=A0AAE5RW33_9HYPH|nr:MULTISPECIES: response regulator [Agrobacterium]KAA3515706.1 response regulator [Agrobacterium rosae]KAA3524666.1 response regulator [Agrobacterium rosae]MCM2431610.1 response regulator [Agrobacterium rosae]MDX8328724.1 response regulator [Agrobacterium rosae]MQB47058.1 response regulator [Agrobacterium rosae]